MVKVDDAFVQTSLRYENCRFLYTMKTCQIHMCMSICIFVYVRVWKGVGLYMLNCFLLL